MVRIFSKRIWHVDHLKSIQTTFWRRNKSDCLSVFVYRTVFTSDKGRVLRNRQPDFIGECSWEFEVFK